jgi:hypothetical protein
MSMSGGQKLQAYLHKLGQDLGNGVKVRVGFLEGATYPDGTPVAEIAAVQEFGATIQIEAHETEVYRSVDKDGGFNQNGRFVKRVKSNFATTHQVPAHSITIPARPFFRGMIFSASPTWGSDFAKILKGADFNGLKAMALMGEHLQDQLKTSIRDFTDPSNAARTIAQKGFNKPLINTSHMLNSVDFHVEESS